MPNGYAAEDWGHPLANPYRSLIPFLILCIINRYIGARFNMGRARFPRNRAASGLGKDGGVSRIATVAPPLSCRPAPAAAAS